MRNYQSQLRILAVGLCSLSLISCSHYSSNGYNSSYYSYYDTSRFDQDLSTRVPQHIATNEKVVVVDPKTHVWGAYGSDGNLIRTGLATAGGEICPPDETGNCRTTPGTYRIRSLGDGGCVSKIYPRPKGGGLMPYCMFFNNGQALHGSPDSTVVEANISHGCVRMRIQDAEWMRYNFASVGTKVIIKPYDSDGEGDGGQM